MASPLSLFGSCMDSLKSILTSQDFGSEYEMLCTELSVQWLRVRLWGQAMGLQDGAPHPQKTIVNRPEVESTIAQTVNAIAFLLTEIEVLRRRYELRPRLIPENFEEEKTQRDSKPRSSRFRPAKYLQQRMKDNQKQKSFLALAKWTVCDAKRFDEKVKRLQNLIDGLEDISKAAGMADSQGFPQNLTSSFQLLVDNPPPYSVEAPPQQAQPVEIIVPATVEPTSVPDVQLYEQYISLKQYAASVETDAPFRLRARQKLSTLNDGQFKELRGDVYDELCRRQQSRTPPPSLPPTHNYHVKRNQAREKMSTLPWHRFSQLVTDVVFELERRCSSLEIITDSIMQSAIAPKEVNRALRRYGQVGGMPTREPPPAMSMPGQLNQCNLATLNSTIPTTIHRHSQTSTTLGQALGPTSSSGHVDSFVFVRPPATFLRSPKFKPFQIKNDHPTSKVIPAAMKKYGMNIPWHKYALYVEYGSIERQLEPDEQPLALFDTLQQQGHKPFFALRRIPNTVEERSVED
ncbi:hypothetical protein N431DRAFT_504056 [Stipitochalara longipes BDJ]|nr:hypothetical protein N431DRAFT_504056 [Stipitochalara longipes BDJ]